ncbi:MAG: M42 family metallopeptidase [Ruminococcaceae bacterium]|nr:M42 family metallopeptidase [Oscillospiraceae bacterium]
MLVKELTSLGAPSGFEDAVRNFIKERATADEIYTDSMGNLICHKKGNGKKVMVAAHMDEVGLIITEITEKGFLKFSTLGGIETAVLCSKKVLIGENSVPGIICAKAIHLQKGDEVNSPLKLKDLCIDIGANDKESAEKLIQMGDYAVFDGVFTPFGNNLVKSKALDDRVGCAILLELMKEDYESDMYFTFTVQEEVGLRGAQVAAFNIKPDIALVVEGTTCSDVYGSKPHNQVTNLGGGAVMTAVDRAAISDKNYYDFIMKTAKEYDIKLQIKRTTMGGTDAGAIQRSGIGVKTAVLAVPCRYIHSPVSVMNFDDADCVYKLAKAVLKNIERSGL